MKTTNLLNAHNEASLLQQNILSYLFSEIPVLQHIQVVRSWTGVAAHLINYNKVPSLSQINTDLFRSWLIEAELKESELHLILRCLPFVGIREETLIVDITRQEILGKTE